MMNDRMTAATGRRGFCTTLIDCIKTRSTALRDALQFRRSAVCNVPIKTIAYSIVVLSSHKRAYLSRRRKRALIELEEEHINHLEEPSHLSDVMEAPTGHTTNESSAQPAVHHRTTSFAQSEHSQTAQEYAEMTPTQCSFADHNADSSVIRYSLRLMHAKHFHM